MQSPWKTNLFFSSLVHGEIWALLSSFPTQFTVELLPNATLQKMLGKRCWGKQSHFRTWKGLQKLTTATVDCFKDPNVKEGTDAELLRSCDRIHADLTTKKEITESEKNDLKDLEHYEF